MKKELVNFCIKQLGHMQCVARYRSNTHSIEIRILSHLKYTCDCCWSLSICAEPTYTNISNPIYCSNLWLCKNNIAVRDQVYQYTNTSWITVLFTFCSSKAWPKLIKKKKRDCRIRFGYCQYWLNQSICDMAWYLKKNTCDKFFVVCDISVMSVMNSWNACVARPCVYW